MTSIDRTAWLKAVGEAEVVHNHPDAVTITDLMEMLTCGRSSAEQRVKKLVKQGFATMVRIKRQDSSGKWRIYNAYVLTKGGADERGRTRRR